MKKHLYIIAIVLCSFMVKGQSEPSYFYYYKGEKQVLELNTDYVYVVITSNVFTKQQLNLYLGNNVEVTRFKQSNVGKTLNTRSGTPAQSSEYWAEVKLNTNLSYSEQINQLEENPSIELVAPYFKNKAEEKIGLSNYFYVKLKNENDLNTLIETSISTNTQIVGQNKFMPLWYTLKCTGNSNYNALEAANFFYESGHFAVAEPDLMVNHALSNSSSRRMRKTNHTVSELLNYTPNDPLYVDQWALNNTGQNGGVAGIDINVEAAWDITKGDPSIIVAVLDQGFEMDHPDLQANVFGQSYDTETGSTPSVVRGPHGTACAGIIGAVQDNEGVSGVAPDASLMSVSNDLILDTNSSQELADGINWAWDDGNADIISNSWRHHGVLSMFIDDAIINALTNGRGGLGTVIIFAVANDNSIVDYPANSNPDILTVGAISPCGERKSPTSCDGENFWGSNFGNELDIMAPGVLIPTTDRQGDILDTVNTTGDYNPWTHSPPNNYLNNDYDRWFNGTSSACPHVAGVAALVLSVNPMLTAQEVNSIIEQSATKVREDLYTYADTKGHPNGTWNNEMGYGLVNAHEAVILAQGCQENLVIIQDVLNGESDSQQAEQTITATNTIFNNANAVYHAGEEVLFQDGFSAENGSDFYSYIAGCSNVVFKAKNQNQAKNNNLNHKQDFNISFKESISTSKLTVFPNPFDWNVSFQFYTKQNAKVVLSIYDLEGKLQLEKKFNYQEEGQQLVETDLSTLPSGTYLYKLFVDKKPFSGKIIKK